MVRLRYSMTIAVSSSSAEEKDLGNGSFEIVHDASGEGGARKTTLAAGATDVSIMMTEISEAKFVALKTNPKTSTDTLPTIEIKKNNIAGEVTNLAPETDKKQAHMLLSTEGVTDLFASNPGTVDVEIVTFMVGD